MKYAGALGLLLLSGLGCGDDGGSDEADDPTRATIALAAATTGGTEEVLLARRQTWWCWAKGGTPAGTDWKAHDWEPEIGWLSLNVPTGFGEGYLVTTIEPGQITYYFRKAFFVEDKAKVQSLVLEAMVDDGFVFYLNGQEGGRVSMPSGTVTPSTLAFAHEAENRYDAFDVSSVRDALQTGWNTLAVEVHQVAASSSDLVFDAALLARIDVGEPPPPSEGGIARGSVWSYWDRGTDLDAAWRVPAYDDAEWRNGPGPLGYGESYLRTTVAFGTDSSNKHITTYFRKKFTLADASAVARLTGELMYDDGAVVYLNGQEIQRAAMPAGTVQASTLATGHEAGNAYELFDWTPFRSLLLTGENTLAVEVHQQTGSSSDLVFDLALSVETGTPPPLEGGIARGASWKYWDLGSTPPIQGHLEWRQWGYSDDTWASGPGPLGYGESYVATTVSYGPSATNKYITTYFRNAFEGGGNVVDLELEVMYDDGFVAYLNGAEIARRSMPAGPPVFSTRASGHEAFNAYDRIPVSGVRLADGRNVVAVEVHQESPASSDLVFDMAVTVTPAAAPGWQRISSPSSASFLGVWFVDANRGWVVGTEGTILRTTNGGATWTFQVSGTTERLTGVQFADASRGWAVGAGGVILSTTDGGGTWVRRSAGTSADFQDLSFVSATTGWIVGGDVNAYKTTDGGATWSAQPVGAEGLTSMHKVKFVDGMVGWVLASLTVVTDAGGTDTRHVILRTANGGGFWAEQFRTEQHNDDLWGMDFVSASTGWVARMHGMVDINGGILATVNEGVSWTGQVYDASGGIYGLDFISTTVGWGVGVSGTIIHTSDGGASWSTQVPSGLTGEPSLVDVHFIDGQTGWAVGDSGVILKTTTGGR